MLWQSCTPGTADTAARMRSSMPAGAESTRASMVRLPSCQHTQITRTDTPSAATASLSRNQPSDGAHSPNLTHARPAITTDELHTSVSKCRASASSAWLLYFFAVRASMREREISITIEMAITAKLQKVTSTSTLWKKRRCVASQMIQPQVCLLYTSDAADDLLCVDLGG